jgi:hypothetical protein
MIDGRLLFTHEQHADIHHAERHGSGDAARAGLRFRA